MLNNFIYAQTKDLFLEQLGSGNILDETIVFIEETGEIWNRGNYFGSKVDISGCTTQEEVRNIVLKEFAKLSKVATTGLYSDLIDKPTIPQHNTYETEALYQEAVTAGEVDAKDLSFVKETGKLYTQGGEYGGGVKWSYLKNCKAGDIVYYDGGKLNTISQDEWNTNLGTPVGVVVVPNGFTPDKKARMISLNQPKEATVPFYPIADTTPLAGYSVLPTTDNAGSVAYTYPSGYLPSDLFNVEVCYTDPEAKYDKGTPMIVSPYRQGKKNEQYYEGTQNALSDFNGIGNTMNYVELGDDSLTPVVAYNYSDGVSPTQWYLPSIGELGFLIVRFKKIRDGVNLVGGDWLYAQDYWSSTKDTNGTNQQFVANPSDGRVRGLYKNSGYAIVRPFAIID